MNTLEYSYQAKVVRWVDGDTVWLDVDLGFRLHSTTDFRLYGINTPERGAPGYVEATARCNALAPTGSQVIIHVFKDPDKYGRWLVIVVPIPVPVSVPVSVPGVPEVEAGVAVNEVLVREGLAVVYFGRRS